MLERIKIANFGPLKHIEWNKLGKINLVIGGNGCGKTFLLKSLYCGMRTLEEYKRGDDQRTASDILREKLYWTFQAEKIGDLVTKGAKKHLSYYSQFDGQDFRYSFGKDTTRQISSLESHVPPRQHNSIFLPSKEVLSLYEIILKTREMDKTFGFDDTYFDLAKALKQSPKRAKNYQEFAESRRCLEDILGGRVEFDEITNRWQFKEGNKKYPIGVTAEGIKKIAILDTLLANRYLTPESILFIDEPESALHPAAISKFLDIIASLAERGIQIIMASHSYFVVKKLLLIAQEKQLSIPIASVQDKVWTYTDLKEGMPDNRIIAESIRLHKEEVELSLS